MRIHVAIKKNPGEQWQQKNYLEGAALSPKQVGNKSTEESFSTQFHCARSLLLGEKKGTFVAQLLIIVFHHNEKDAVITEPMQDCTNKQKNPSELQWNIWYLMERNCLKRRSRASR